MSQEKQIITLNLTYREIRALQIAVNKTIDNANYNDDEYIDAGIRYIEEPLKEISSQLWEQVPYDEKRDAERIAQEKNDDR